LVSAFSSIQFYCRRNFGFSVSHPKELSSREAFGAQNSCFAVGETSAYNAFYREAFPMAQRELRTPDALRVRGLLTDNILQREVSFTVEETLVSVYRTLKNFRLAKRLERKTPVLPLEKPLLTIQGSLLRSLS
jgi:hypothetical protein